MSAKKRIEGKSSLIFFKCSLVIKKGESNNEAIKSLEKTRVIGPTSGADTLINKKEAPQAIPMAIIKDQSKTEFLFINVLLLTKEA